MNWRAIGAIVRKELKVILRTKAVVLPVILIPVLMQVVLPAGLGIMANTIPAGETDIQEMGQLLAQVQPILEQQFGTLNDKQLFLILMLVYMFAPFYLIVPLMVASVIAADSFAGEKERKTLEAVLHTPITSQELLTGKMLSAWLPAFATALGCFVLYGVVTNVVGWPLMGRIFFPNATWIVLVLWVSPAVSGFGLGISVLVSARVKTFQEAYQLGGIVVLPIVALMIGQLAGVFYLNVGFSVLMGAVIWLIDGALLWFGVKTFQREKLLAQL